MVKLTMQQQKFADNILVMKLKKGWSDAKCCMDAYPKIKSVKTGEANASRLLRNAKIAAYIDKQRAKIAKKTEISVERLLKEEACIAYSNLLGALFVGGETTIPPSELPEDVQRAVSSVEIRTKTYTVNDEPITETTYKYRLWDKGRALERLEKYKGMFEKDNQQKGALDKDTRDAVVGALRNLMDGIAGGPQHSDTFKT